MFSNFNLFLLGHLKAKLKSKKAKIPKTFAFLPFIFYFTSLLFRPDDHVEVGLRYLHVER